MSTPRWRLDTGQALDHLAALPDASVQCVVTSPPYWGLRDYGVDGQIGLEDTFSEFLDKLIDVFDEVRRVLRPDGVCWLNMGDSYASRAAGRDARGRDGLARPLAHRQPQQGPRHAARPAGMKDKDLIGQPWRLALALQEAGWWLRSEVIWAKPTPMPESVRDRPTRAHEQIFLLAKSRRYFYDADAVRRPLAASTRRTWGPAPRKSEAPDELVKSGRFMVGRDRRPALTDDGDFLGANQRTTWQPDDPASVWRWAIEHAPEADQPALRRSAAAWAAARAEQPDVWTIASQPYPEAHFATFPPALVEPCVLAGTSAHGACSICGAPWARTTHRARLRPDGEDVDGPWRPESGRWREHGGAIASGRAHDQATAVRTLGWQPTCPHIDAPTQPCVVLDPFAGAGTTLMVALRLGRSALGIELNPDYATQARQRILADQPMLNDAWQDAS